MLRALAAACARSPACSRVMPGDETTEPGAVSAAVKKLFATERGGQKLSPLVVELLTNHYVESIMIDDVKSVVMEEVLESAGEAWEEAYGRAPFFQLN